MKGPLYISDDEKKQGTQAEVEAYEAALNPLAKFKFPWAIAGSRGYRNATRGYFETVDDEAVALLNLMPLVEEMRQTFTLIFPGWRKMKLSDPTNIATKNLLLDYEKALGIEELS